MLYIFPDTNIFIHGKHFEEIDWLKFLSVDQVTLVIAPIVISELDKHKYNPNARISRRVKKLMPNLEAIIEGTDTCKYRVKVILKNPVETIFIQHHLDKRENDDILLAGIMEFIQTIETGDSVILITNDTGPRLKAKAHSIRTSRLSEEYMQSPEPEETEKQIRGLQDELRQLKTTIPEVSVFFKNGGKFLSAKRPDKLKSKEECVEKELINITREFPPMIYYEGDVMILPGPRVIPLPKFRVTESQINDYNKKLEHFFEEYEQYFASKYDYVIYRANCIEVDFEIKNIGSAPATDIDVYFNFPLGFDIVVETDFPEINKKPSPPYRPKHSMDFQAFDNSAKMLTAYHSSLRNPFELSQINANVSSPEIRKKNGHEVSFSIKSVKHNQSAYLETLYIKFTDIFDAKGFNIDFKIMAANIPKMITGQLQVKFENDN